MTSFIHVAVIHGVYLDLILSGRKTIETRLSLTRRTPYGKATTGERIYFKERSGPIRGTALIGRVDSHENLTPELVRKIGTQHNRHILGPDEFWTDKSSAKYATLLWLTNPQRVEYGPDVPRFHRSAWIRIAADRCVYPGCVDGKKGIQARGIKASSEDAPID
ncbi:MAG: ASCH domain-containing protein [Pyrinomonadaceae bacterium]|nr:ASCH domain-containing protein [Phycisphaerales bacterium]